jgi:hypothetical protein
MLHGGLPPHVISGRVGHHALACAFFWLQVAACAWCMYRLGIRAVAARAPRAAQGFVWGWVGGQGGGAGSTGGTLQALQHSAEVFRWKPGLPRPHTTARSPEYPVWAAVWHVGSSVTAAAAADPCTSA